MKQSKVSIGLVNPKNPDNVGSVMRAAGNFRVESVFYTGERYSRAKKYKSCTASVSRKVGQSIPLSGVDCLADMNKNRRQLFNLFRAIFMGTIVTTVVAIAF